MKKILSLISLCLPLAAIAQPPAGMSQQRMEKMMENARKMQECMQNIDQESMEGMAEKSRKIAQRIESLCRAGKRDQAQRFAIESGREMAASEEMRKMQECSKMMQGMMPQTTLPSEKELQQRHICDDY